MNIDYIGAYTDSEEPYHENVARDDLTDFAIITANGNNAEDSVYPYTYVKDIVPVAEQQMNTAEGYRTYRYGEYPQQMPSAEKRKELEHAYHNKNLRETGKVYTILTPKGDERKYKEYEYDGKKYVRVSSTNPITITRGHDSAPISREEIKACKPEWIEVQPVWWQELREENGESNHVVTSMTLFEGRYNKETGYDDKFDKWFKEYFVKEILPLDEYLKLQKKEMGVSENETPKPRRRGFGVEVDEKPMSVTEQIKFYVQTGKSFMLHGPAGIGKSARVEAIDPDLTAVPLWNGVLPEDIVGKVRYSSGETVSAVNEKGEAVSQSGGVWVPPDWYVELCRKCTAEPDKMHVLFIDEVTNARPTTQSLIFNIVLRKSISAGNGDLPKNSIVALAGNNKEESGAAYNMPEPLFRRMCGHIYLKPDIEEWLEWGSQKSTKHPEDAERLNIHPVVSAFVATYGKDCFYTSFDEDNPKLAMDPRSWEQISDIIYDNKGIIRRELLESKMGKEFAATFIEFAKNPPLTAEDVMSGNIEGLPIPQRPDEKLALVCNLRHVKEKQVGKVRGFVRRHLGKECCAVFDKMWCEGNPERVIFLKQLDKKLYGDGINRD